MVDYVDCFWRFFCQPPKAKSKRLVDVKDSKMIDRLRKQNKHNSPVYFILSEPAQAMNGRILNRLFQWLSKFEGHQRYIFYFESSSLIKQLHEKCKNYTNIVLFHVNVTSFASVWSQLSSYKNDHHAQLSRESLIENKQQVTRNEFKQGNSVKHAYQSLSCVSAQRDINESMVVSLLLDDLQEHHYDCAKHWLKLLLLARYGGIYLNHLLSPNDKSWDVSLSGFNYRCCIIADKIIQNKQQHFLSTSFFACRPGNAIIMGAMALSVEVHKLLAPSKHDCGFKYELISHPLYQHTLSLAMSRVYHDLPINIVFDKVMFPLEDYVTPKSFHSHGCGHILREFSDKEQKLFYGFEREMSKRLNSDSKSSLSFFSSCSLAHQKFQYEQGKTEQRRKLRTLHKKLLMQKRVMYKKSLS